MCIEITWVSTELLSLFAGGDSGSAIFVLDGPAVNGSITLTPSAEGIIFTPGSVAVAAGATQSDEVLVQVTGTVPVSIVTVHLSIEGHASNNNILPSLVSIEAISVNQLGMF